MNIIRYLVQFVKEAYFELKKVSWLSKKQVAASTVIVIIFVLIVALYVGIVDLVLSKILEIVIGAR
ncbi:MAG: preprotein translocase subunit SecE [Elusimicrobiota bacterium]